MTALTGSVAFVYIYLWVHSGSAFLAMCGMLHIMMSFPLAFFLYRYLFGIMPFYILSFLAIYVILAIGADDVFVFMDAWRQSATMGAEINRNLHTRMAYTYKRAAKAMLITSATTFGAFVATAVSPLGEVATFGLFTALLVVANYVFVITYFPAVVICYHRRFENTQGCCCCIGQRLVPRTPEYGGGNSSASPGLCQPAVPNNQDNAVGAVLPMQPVNPQRHIQMIQLTMPQNVEAGSVREFSVEGKVVKVTIPEGVQPGANFQVEVPGPQLELIAAETPKRRRTEVCHGYIC